MHFLSNFVIIVRKLSATAFIKSKWVTRVLIHKKGSLRVFHSTLTWWISDVVIATHLSFSIDLPSVYTYFYRPRTYLSSRRIRDLYFAWNAVIDRPDRSTLLKEHNSLSYYSNKYPFFSLHVCLSPFRHHSIDWTLTCFKCQLFALFFNARLYHTAHEALVSP